jgi:hypothetical protein
MNTKTKRAKREAKSKTTDQLAVILKRYRVNLRKDDSVVFHQGYETNTRLTPSQFAIYEAAVCAVYISNQTFNKLRGNWHAFMNTMGYYQTICDRDRTGLPYIANSWGEEKAKQAAQDYHYLADLLKHEEGIDEASKEK